MISGLQLGPTMIAVDDIEASRAYYRDVLGADSTPPQVVNHGGFLRCWVAFDGGSFQLMQPLEGEKVLTKFLATRGEGFYGQIFLTDDLDASHRQVTELGLRVVGDIIDLGDMRELVLHPSATNGMLTVLRELTPR